MRTSTTSAMLAAVVAAAAPLLGACSHKLPPIAARPLPTPSTRTALRDPSKPLSPRIASYTLAATLDGKAHRITATETLHWRNDGSAPVTEIPLHLYMNAFKNESTAFMQESHGQHRSAKMADDKWGYIDVSSIKVAKLDGATVGQELRPLGRYGMAGGDETTMTLPLPAPVAPGAELALDFAFTTQLPQVFARTGFMGEFTMVGQWFPKIGVLTTETAADGAKHDVWHCDTFHLNSEFFADFGVYDVTLTVPDTQLVVATGVLTKAAAGPGGTHVLTYHAEDVHDFVWMADPYMRTISGKADGDVDVIVAYRPDQEAFARRHLEAAIQSVDRFSKHFYKYPWASMTIIDPPPDAAEGAGGMEYPTVVTTAADVAPAVDGLMIPEFVTIHEVGHNWFQGILASNEVDEAWLDEGINEYVDGVVLDEWRGPDAEYVLWGWRMGYYPEHSREANARHLSTPIATKSYLFPTNGEYGAATYAATSVALKTLENRIGRDKFLAAMGVYSHAWAFRHPTKEDFFGALEHELGPEIDPYLRAVFEGKGGVDYRLQEVSTKKTHAPRGLFGEPEGRKTVDDKSAPDGDGWTSTVVVADSGTVPTPVDVELVFEDGEHRRETWARTDPHDGAHRFDVTSKSELVEVDIDPDGKVPLEHDILDDSQRLSGRNGASWRAAARSEFWEQTLISVVGL